jgi:hypothetical protein
VIGKANDRRRCRIWVRSPDSADHVAVARPTVESEEMDTSHHRSLDQWLLSPSMSTVLSAIGVPKLARECDLMLGQITSAGSPIAIAIGALSASTVALGTRALWKAHSTNKRSWMEPGVGTRISRRGPFEFVLLADGRPHALSVPATSGRSSQVLVTTGLVEALSPDELDLVCAHEEAHLRHGHSRYLAVASAIEWGVWFWPPARSSAQTMRVALERWADEVAVGDEQISRGRLRSALLIVATEGEFSGLAAFSGVDGLIERLSAMDEPTEVTAPVVWLPMLRLPGLALGTLASLAILQLGHATYCVLSMAGSCRLH